MFNGLMILGPTASGKTALSLAVARVIPSEIISIDSALIYRGMDVGSAKPTEEERGGVPHHLIDIRDIGDSYSVAEFLGDCRRLVPEIRARGRLPILAGGTMLYANALMKGLADLPDTPPEVRAEVTAEGVEKGWPAMWDKLWEADPVTAARLSKNDSQRIGRALEVFRITGKPLSELIAKQRQTAPEFNFALMALIPGDRAKLHQAIEKRFDVMLENDFLGEVKRLSARPDFDPESPAMRCVGYRQALQYLRGEADEKEFRERAVAATRQLAKRQITWLRSMEGKTVFDPYAPAGMKEAEVWAEAQDYGLK